MKVGNDQARLYVTALVLASTGGWLKTPTRMVLGVPDPTADVRLSNNLFGLRVEVHRVTSAFEIALWLPNAVRQGRALLVPIVGRGLPYLRGDADDRNVVRLRPMTYVGDNLCVTENIEVTT